MPTDLACALNQYIIYIYTLDRIRVYSSYIASVKCNVIVNFQIEQVLYMCTDMVNITFSVSSIHTLFFFLSLTVVVHQV